MKRKTKRSSSPTAFETLEDRRMMSASDCDTVWPGTSGNDALRVYLQPGAVGGATANGNHDGGLFMLSDTGVMIHAYGGNDTIDIYGQFDLPVYILGGSGNDTIRLHGRFTGPLYIWGNSGDDTIQIGGGDLDSNYTQPVEIDGGDGYDALGVNDLNDVHHDNYSILSDSTGWTSLLKSNTAGQQIGSRVEINNEIEQLVVDCNNYNNQVDVDVSNASALAVVGVRGNGAGDTMNVTHRRTAITQYSFDGGVGSNSMRFADYRSGGKTYTMHKSGIRDTAFSAHWLSAQTVDIEGTMSGDRFSLESVGVATTTIRGLGGDDFFAVGNGSISSANFPVTAVVNLRGGSGRDTLSLYDSDTTANTTHTLGSTKYSHSGTCDFNLDAFNAMTLFAGSGNDIIAISDPHDGLEYLSVFAGRGNDVIVGTSGNEWISGGEGTDTIYGGGGNDTINQ